MYKNHMSDGFKPRPVREVLIDYHKAAGMLRRPLYLNVVQCRYPTQTPSRSMPSSNHGTTSMSGNAEQVTLFKAELLYHLDNRILVYVVYLIDVSLVYNLFPHRCTLL